MPKLYSAQEFLTEGLKFIPPSYPFMEQLIYAAVLALKSNDDIEDETVNCHAFAAMTLGMGKPEFMNLTRLHYRDFPISKSREINPGDVVSWRIGEYSPIHSGLILVANSLNSVVCSKLGQRGAICIEPLIYAKRRYDGFLADNFIHNRLLTSVIPSSLFTH